MAAIWRISNSTSGEFESPLPWYFVRIARASSVRPTRTTGMEGVVNNCMWGEEEDVRQRGDSGMNHAQANTILDGRAWN
jgi:hypothetical protein